MAFGITRLTVALSSSLRIDTILTALALVGVRFAEVGGSVVWLAQGWEGEVEYGKGGSFEEGGL